METKLQENDSLVIKSIRNALFFSPVDIFTPNHIHQDVLHIRLKKSSHPTVYSYGEIILIGFVRLLLLIM